MYPEFVNNHHWRSPWRVHLELQKEKPKLVLWLPMWCNHNIQTSSLLEFLLFQIFWLIFGEVLKERTRYILLEIYLISLVCIAMGRRGWRGPGKNCQVCPPFLERFTFVVYPNDNKSSGVIVQKLTPPLCQACVIGVLCSLAPGTS